MPPQAGVAPFEAGAIDVWSPGLSKPRADGVFDVVLTVMKGITNRPLP